MAVRPSEAYHVDSTVPQEPPLLIPHTETSIDKDHEYAVFFLENQEITLQNAFGETLPLLAHHLEYRLKNITGKCYHPLLKVQISLPCSEGEYT